MTLQFSYVHDLAFIMCPVTVSILPIGLGCASGVKEMPPAWVSTACCSPSIHITRRLTIVLRLRMCLHRVPDIRAPFLTLWYNNVRHDAGFAADILVLQRRWIGGHG